MSQYQTASESIFSKLMPTTVGYEVKCMELAPCANSIIQYLNSKGFCEYFMYIMSSETGFQVDKDQHRPFYCRNVIGSDAYYGILLKFLKNYNKDCFDINDFYDYNLIINCPGIETVSYFLKNNIGFKSFKTTFYSLIKQKENFVGNKINKLAIQDTSKEDFVMSIKCNREDDTVQIETDQYNQRTINTFKPNEKFYLKYKNRQFDIELNEIHQNVIFSVLKADDNTSGDANNFSQKPKRHLSSLYSTSHGDSNTFSQSNTMSIDQEHHRSSSFVEASQNEDHSYFDQSAASSTRFEIPTSNLITSNSKYSSNSYESSSSYDSSYHLIAGIKNGDSILIVNITDLPIETTTSLPIVKEDMAELSLESAYDLYVEEIRFEEALQKMSEFLSHQNDEQIENKSKFACIIEDVNQTIQSSLMRLKSFVSSKFNNTSTIENISNGSKFTRTNVTTITDHEVSKINSALVESQKFDDCLILLENTRRENKTLSIDTNAQTSDTTQNILILTESNNSSIQKNLIDNGSSNTCFRFECSENSTPKLFVRPDCNEINSEVLINDDKSNLVEMTNIYNSLLKYDNMSCSLNNTTSHEFTSNNSSLHTGAFTNSSIGFMAIYIAAGVVISAVIFAGIKSFKKVFKKKVTIEGQWEEMTIKTDVEEVSRFHETKYSTV